VLWQEDPNEFKKEAKSSDSPVFPPTLYILGCRFLFLFSQGDTGQKGLPGPPGPPGYGSQGIKVSESDCTGIVSQVSRVMTIRTRGFITKFRFSESVTVKIAPGI
jgi:hypothetical protein